MSVHKGGADAENSAEEPKKFTLKEEVEVEVAEEEQGVKLNILDQEENLFQNLEQKGWFLS